MIYAWENRIKVVRKLRELRPRVVILPYWQGRHPDYYNSARSVNGLFLWLGTTAFLAGFAMRSHSCRRKLGWWMT
jgi:LmbE family N-acetylglucosaminyl deacetylase